jgi:DNA polymerase theta
MHKAAHNGCCRRAAQTRALGSVLRKLLVSEKLTDLVETIEGPLVYSVPLHNENYYRML